MYQVRTMEELAADAVAQPKMLLALLTVFAGAAMLLAAIGIYGVLAHTVGQRTREIGLRLALGADRVGVMGLVIRQAVQYAVLGLCAGLVAAAAVGRLMETLLFGVHAVDAATYAVVAGGFLAVALLAAWIPARRAATVDPLTALRAN